MKIIHSYLLRTLLVNLFYCLFVFIFLFLVVDFLDRIDLIVSEGGSLYTTISYFALKIPQIVTLVIPIAMLTATLFTIGILSKNSELTAMRASGLTILWIARPVILMSLVLSFLSLLLSQTIVPYSTRRVREIYNIDIRKKDKTGSYSRSNFWWREGNNFYTSKMFDSRNDTLTDVTLFTLNNDMHIRKRSDVEFINFLEPGYGWVMQNVEERIFKKNKNTPQIVQHVALPLTLNKLPKDFYSVDPEPDTMSYSELRKFMQEQSANGLPVNHLLADYHEKFSFPFVTTIITLIVINFSILPARSGSMAAPIILSLGFSFSYYAIHSFCVALGRAEVVNPMLAAWLANTIYGMLALILISSIENQN